MNIRMDYIVSAQLRKKMTDTKYTPLQSQIARSGLRINIFKSNYDKEVILEFPPPQFNIEQIDLSSDVDKQIKDLQNKFFEDLRDTINEMSSLGIQPGAIIFHGGGTLAIPDWFKNFCKNKIEILVYNSEDNNTSFDAHLNANRFKIITNRLPEIKGMFDQLC